MTNEKWKLTNGKCICTSDVLLSAFRLLPSAFSFLDHPSVLPESISYL